MAGVEAKARFPLRWVGMWMALTTGVLLGFSAGVAPGPMLALVLTQTLQHGTREGCKVAVAPLVTDLPIICAALALAGKLVEIRPLLGLVSLAGAGYVFYLVWRSFRPLRPGVIAPAERPRSWQRGIATNLLNPHPWLFWLTVGTAILAQSVAQGWWVAVAFLAGFYALLVGSKLAIAWLAGRSRGFLVGRPYQAVIRLLGVLLGLFAILLLKEGLKHLALI